jgi:endogenous inhibitor of DNA gyrase (YacG/DUF329 family)
MSDRKARVRAPRCPICKEPAATEHRPFCSRRCADIDLGRWFNGSYSVPVVEPSEEDMDELESLAQSDESEPNDYL